MPVTHYNPCTDGFPAKAWECLRRNEAFKKQLEEITKLKDPDDRHWTGEGYAYEAERIGNEFAALIFSSAKDWNTNTCWKDLPRKKQNDFASKFRKGRKISLSSQDFFTGEELAAHTPECINSEKNVAENLEEINFLREHYDFIAVPKNIIHDAHRLKILDDISALIPTVPKKIVTYKPTGSTLCTEQEWSTFLDHEEWTRLGFERQAAANLAAERKGDNKAKNPLLAAERKRVLDEHPLYGVKASQGTDVERKKAANKFLKLKPHPHRTRAEKRISSVEQAIVSVFPSFSLFSSK